MCDLCLPRDGVSRRTLLVGLAATAASLALGRPALAQIRISRQVTNALVVVPRWEWGPHLKPRGDIFEEPAVRFLLIHHSVNRNDYSEPDVVRLLERIYRLHTSSARGWPDIAYNFLVDRFGVVYEGRTGSLEGPKAGDATGGNQGFSQLCCFIGDHRVEAPTYEIGRAHV